MTKYVIIDENNKVAVIFDQKQIAIAHQDYIPARETVPVVPASDAVLDEEGNVIHPAVEEIPAVPGNEEVPLINGRALPEGYAEVKDNDPRIAAYYASLNQAFVVKDADGKITQIFAGPPAEPFPDGYVVTTADDPAFADYAVSGAWVAYQNTAAFALTKSDTTVLRCAEDGIHVPAEWVAYRKALRAIISATEGDATAELPTRPAYPVVA